MLWYAACNNKDGFRPMRGLLALLLAWGAWLPAAAATLEKLTLDEMIQKSTAIVRARVVGARAARRGPMIYTHWRVQVLERWKGSPAEQVEVVTPGGATGGLEQTFSGAPTLAEGAEYVLYLWTGKSGLTHVIGLTQGLFDVRKDLSGEVVVTRGASTETMLDPRTGAVVRDESVSMRLADMSERIRRRLAEEKQ